MNRIEKKRRPGLTLIELVVVLVILVALGGIAVATIPNLLNRTHVATVASTLSAVDAAVKQHALLNSGAIGDNFDSLVTGPADLDGTVAAYVNSSGAYAEYTLAAEDVAALQGIGVSTLVPATPAPDNATFEGHDNLPVVLAAGKKVAVLSVPLNTLGKVWNYTPKVGAQYIVVGVGPKCSLVGANEGAHFSEAPVHFVDAHSERANKAYARVMLVLELADAGTADAEARYIGAGAPYPDRM